MVKLAAHAVLIMQRFWFDSRCRYVKVTTCNLAYRRDLGPHLVIEEMNVFWLFMELLGDHFWPKVTFHLFCCNTPEWTARIRWGRLDSDGYTDRCVFHYLWKFGQWLMLGFNAYKHQRRVADVPVTAEWVHQHYPDADPIMSGDDLDTGDGWNSRPEDNGDILLLCEQLSMFPRSFSLLPLSPCWQCRCR